MYSRARGGQSPLRRIAARWEPGVFGLNPVTSTRSWSASDLRSELLGRSEWRNPAGGEVSRKVLKFPLQTQATVSLALQSSSVGILSRVSQMIQLHHCQLRPRASLLTQVDPANLFVKWSSKCPDCFTFSMRSLVSIFIKTHCRLHESKCENGADQG